LAAVGCLEIVLFVCCPRVADAQVSAGDESEAPRLSVHAAAGVTLPNYDEGGGDLQSISIGYSPTPKLTVLMGVGRIHRPTLRRYSDGVTSLTRGGTVQFVSGEVRFALPFGERVFPYAFTGGGLGVQRSNVNADFPDRVTNAAYLMFGGGGLAVPLGSHLRVTGDVGVLLLGEYDVFRSILPVRVGLAWSF
jgi:hypothetical protein